MLGNSGTNGIGTGLESSGMSCVFGLDDCELPGTGAWAVESGRGGQPPIRICLSALDGAAGNYPIGPSAGYQDAGLACSGASSSKGFGDVGLYSLGGGDLGRFLVSGESAPSLERGT